MLNVVLMLAAIQELARNKLCLKLSDERTRKQRYI